jgi:SRSO17 transposase
MRETTPAAMPPCFERWCARFDDCFKTKAQTSGFMHYISGLLGESERKNLTQMANNAVGVIYNRIHHFLTEAEWSVSAVNERRLKVIDKCSQTRIRKGFVLIIDDSGHRKSGARSSGSPTEKAQQDSGNFTDGVGRQYIGEIGKTENGIVVVTTHLYDGTKSLPLDLEIYRKASEFEQGKKDPEFKKKPTIAIELIERSGARGYRPSIVLMDGGYGNNSNLLKELEQKKLKYLGRVAKNRKVIIKGGEGEVEVRLDEIAAALLVDDLDQIELKLSKKKRVWVKTFKARISSLEGERTFAIVMNASSLGTATDVDYLMTNIEESKATSLWMVTTYSQRNWVEVFYREAKGWLGFSEYQVRDIRSLHRHFILVFCAYTFIIWHKLTGGFQRRWASKSLETFADALAAFRTAMSFRFFNWLTENINVFAAHQADLGLIWA